MKFQNMVVGRIGEEAAAKFLLNLGYSLITRNFSTRFGEIDLIMKDKGVLVFVEVKTKKGLIFGTPEEMFTRGKYNRVKRMGTVYLKGEEVPCRIDMVAVLLNEFNEVETLKHYPNVIL